MSGRAAGPSATIPLHAGTDHVGDLVVGLPEHHHELPRATDAVLLLVAGPLARALQSARLAEEVQRSRRQVVLAAEEERRRLRRDLHDGLGPVLAGVAYTADAARNVVADRPERATELLADLRGDVAGAIAEVRRLVHDLRPAVLDQLGLVPALRQQAERITQDPGGPTVSIDADAVGTLPAAVEVVAYRVATEAVLNVVRHAGAGCARITVRRGGDALEVLVVDDGRAGTPWTAGVGLTSMRERLEQLGGVLEAGATADGRPGPRADPARGGLTSSAPREQQRDALLGVGERAVVADQRGLHRLDAGAHERPVPLRRGDDVADAPAGGVGDLEAEPALVDRLVARAHPRRVAELGAPGRGHVVGGTGGGEDVAHAGLAREPADAGEELGARVEVDPPAGVGADHAVVGDDGEQRVRRQLLGDRADEPVDDRELHQPRRRARAERVPEHVEVAVVGVAERAFLGRARARGRRAPRRPGRPGPRPRGSGRPAAPPG